MFDVQMRLAKESFFDRARVMNAVDRARVRALSRYGAYVRRVAQNSMKKRRGSSPPGQPPHVHVGLLKRHIYFSYDAKNKSVVVGPILIRSGSSVPSVLEYGGRHNKTQYAARPYMRAAQQKSLEKLRDFLKDVL